MGRKHLHVGVLCMADNVTEVMISVRRKPDDIVLYIFTFSLVLREDVCSVRLGFLTITSHREEERAIARAGLEGAEGPSAPGRKI